jgi:hypothetical protein
VIDFRYHLVSIVAVLLALGVGLVVGSGFIGGPLLDDIEERADNIRARNEELRDLADQRFRTITEHSDFAEEAGPYLLGRRLAGVEVILLETDGVGGDLSDGIATAIAAGGGNVVTTIEFKDRFLLEDQLEVDELALSLGSAQEEPEEIRDEAASTLGARLASAADGSDGNASRNRLESLLSDLEEAGFVSISVAEEGASTVPSDAAFLLLAGADDQPPFPVDEFFLEMSSAIAQRGSAVIVCEPTDGTWEVISAVMDDSGARARVATASGVERPSGAITAALVLDRARRGEIGHHGFGPEASTVLPEPTPTPAS